MAQRAVAGHIAGMVQERHSAAAASAANVAVVPGHEDRHTAEHPASADNPGCVEETVKSSQTRDVVDDSPRVRVPVELKISPQSVAVNYKASPTSPTSPRSASNIRPSPASPAVGLFDVDNEYMVNLCALSTDSVDERQSPRRRHTDDQKLFPAKIIVMKVSVNGSRNGGRLPSWIF